MDNGNPDNPRNPRNRRALVEWSAALGYHFQNPTLLEQAMVHRSHAFERGRSSGRADNERLEFLGDAVLDLAISTLLFQAYPRLPEGDLSRRRAALVNEGHLALVARQIGLDRFLLLGRGEARSGGRDKPSILAAAFEALVGAVYLDGGYQPAHELLSRLFAPGLEEVAVAVGRSDAKTALQEILQERHGVAPAYELAGEEGPAHAKSFTVAVRFQERILGRGTAGSKKEAEQQAAAAALAELP